MSSKYSYINWRADNKSLYSQIMMEATMLDMENESLADFLSYGLDRNTCLFVMAMKQFSPRLSAEDNQILQEKLLKKIDKGYISTDVAFVANICLTLLFQGDIETLSSHLQKANRKIYHSSDQKRFSDYCNEMLFTDLFNNQQRILFLNLKYRNLSETFSGNDIFMTERNLPVNLEVNDDLLELFQMAFSSSDYAYLNSLITIAPGLTLEKLHMTREQLKNTASTVTKDFGRFMAFSQTMMCRCSSDPIQKLADLDYWRQEIMTQVLTEKETMEDFFDLYYLCQRIIIDPENANGFLNDTDTIVPIGKGLNNYIIKQAQEQAFYALFRNDCKAVPLLIERLAENNLFRFIDGKDYVSAVAISDTVLQGHIEAMKNSGFENREIVDIYMNSPLRSILSINEFFRLLYYPRKPYPDREMYRNLQSVMSGYAFIGKPAQSRDRKTIMITHGYRNSIEPVRISVNKENGTDLKTLIRNKATVVFHIKSMTYSPSSQQFMLQLVIDEDNELLRSYEPSIDLSSEDRQINMKILEQETDSMTKLQMIIRFYRDGKIFRDDFNRLYAEAIEHVTRLFERQFKMNTELLDAVFASLDSSVKVTTLIECFRFKRNYFRYGSTLSEDNFRILRENMESGEISPSYPEGFRKLADMPAITVFQKVNLYNSSPLRYLISLPKACKMMDVYNFRTLFSKGLYLTGNIVSVNSDGSAEYCHLVNSDETIRLILDNPEEVKPGECQRILIRDRNEDGSYSSRIVIPEK